MKEIILDDFSEDKPVLKAWKFHLIAGIRMMISYIALLVYADFMWNLLNSKNDAWVDFKLILSAFFFMFFMIWLLFQIAVSLVEFSMTSEHSLADLDGTPSSLNILILLVVIFGICFFTMRYVESHYADFSLFLPGIGIIGVLSIVWFIVKKEVHDFVEDFS